MVPLQRQGASDGGQSGQEANQEASDGHGKSQPDDAPVWETVLESGEHPRFVEEYARIWQSAAKVVYSKTLRTTRTTIEREFDPQTVRQMKASAIPDMSVGGPDLAAQALKAGLVDECHLLMSPVVVGGGNRAMPLKVRFQLELLEEWCFGNGVVHLHYRVIG